MVPKKRLISLFSGCGGMDLGFEGGFRVRSAFVNPFFHPDWVITQEAEWVTLAPTCFETVFANDIEEHAKRAWNLYFGQRRNVASIYNVMSIVDIVKIVKNGIMKVFPDSIDILTGGFPCNDFSVAGKRNGFDSHRSHSGEIRLDEPSVESRGQLYIWMKEVIEITQPKVFVAENVKGLVSLKDVKNVIENDFRRIGGGYVVVPARVLYAPDYGIPQTRERIIFMGFKRSCLRPEALIALCNDNIPMDYDPYPIQTHSKIGGNGCLAYSTVRQALDGLGEPEDSDDLSHRFYSKAKFMGAHCQGQKEVDLDSLCPTIRAEHHGNIEYRRLSLEHGGRRYDELHNNLHERRLSVRECARLQTFPDDFRFVVKEAVGRSFFINSTSGYKMIGNAVPPLLAYHLAKRIEFLWDKIFEE